MADPAAFAAPATGGEADLASRLASLEASSTQAQLLAESTIHELQLQLTSLQSELDTEREAKEVLKRNEVELNEQVQRLQASLQQAHSSDGVLKEKELEWQKEKEQLQREKRDLLELVEKAELDKSQSQDSLNSLRDLHSNLQSSNSQLEASLLESTTSARSSLLKMQTLQSTVASLESDKSFLTNELERVRSEYSTSRRTTHAQIAELNEQLSNTKTELDALKSTHNALQTSHTTLQERHQETLASLAQTREGRETVEASFVLEMSGMKRLVERMEAREQERKLRIDQVEQLLVEKRAALAQREAEVVEELERERERCDQLENRVAELRTALERGAIIGGNAGDESPARFALSPSAQLAARGQKGGRSYAQVYAEYIRMEEELVLERAESKRLSDCLAQILADIEERAPLMKEQRLEYERLSQEATQLAAQLAEASSEREQADRTATSARLDVERLQQENSMLDAQLRDLGRQVRSLARQNALITGVVTSGAPEDFDEEEAEIVKRAEVDLSTDAVVSAHLVTFKTINELQVQNQKLLRITREMGDRMERADEDAQGRRRWEENKAVEEAHELILKLKEEIENQQLKIDGFARERDMFRRMLANSTGQGKSSAPAANGADLANGHDSSDRLLADVQANFDAYKAEIAIDSQRLRDDLKEAQHSAQSARTELAKAKAQAEFSAERLQLLGDTHNLQTNELAQTSKRALDLQQTLARQEAVSHRLSEELIEVRGTVDQLRHENTNLKSEREVAISVQSRLAEENAALSKERAHLADLMRNLQSMQNELERSGNDARRRLEAQVLRLEAQTVDLKQKLDAETDGSRQLSLRKDFEARQLQERLDKLQADYSATREKLVEAETARTHLDQRVSDLQLQVTSREEKLAIYEGRSAAARASGDSGLSVTEQLEMTVADLRVELQETKAKLERSTVHATELQAIADAQGSALAELQATYDAFKVSVDAQIIERDSEIANIRERLHSLTTDLTAQSTENSELHAQIESERVAFEKERKALEDTLASVRTQESGARQAQSIAQGDLRQQAQKAREAHEKYERELVAHAEDVKQVSDLKGKLEQAKRATREAQNETHVAKANLVSSEQSWLRQKTTLEGELADVKKRCEDLTSQNNLLHQHLEKMTSQAASLQKAAGANGEAGERAEGAAGEGDAPTSAPTDDLHSVIKFLRSEKEIVDFQLDLSKQEATRLRTQLDFATRNLEDARLALAEERQSGPGSAAASSQHAELMERIHQAELLRESNNTLREDNRKMLRANKTLETRVVELRTQLEPLKEQAVTLQAELEAKNHTVRLLEEDNERWKLRNQTILAKYERIDPEELTTLKAEVERLQGAADETKQRLTEIETEKTSLQEQVAEQTKIAESMRENWTNSQGRFKALQAQARVTRDEKLALEKAMAEIQAKIDSGELAASNAGAAASSTPSAEVQAQLSALEIEKASLEAQVQQQAETIKTLEARVAALESDKANTSSSADERVTALEAERKALADKVDYYAKRETPIFADNKKMKIELREKNAQLVTLQTSVEELTKLKEEFESKNAEAIEKVVQERVAAIEAQPSDAAAVEEMVKTKVAEVESRLAAEREESIKAAVDSATSELNKTLESVRAELSAAKEAAAAASTSTTRGDDGAAQKAFDEQLAKAKSDFESSKATMQTEFDQLKSKLAEEAKAREKEITDRLTTELTKLKSEAAASTSTADIDALVQSKLAELEKGRLESQKAAIKQAVDEALTKQAQENEEQMTERLQKAREQVQDEANRKSQLMTTMKNKIQAQLKVAQDLLKANNIEIPKPGAAATTAPATPTVAATTGATSTSSSESGTPPPSGGRVAGRGGIRGGKRGGGAGRGGGAAGAGPSTPAASTTNAPASPSGPPSLSVKNAAAKTGDAAGGPKGLLGKLFAEGGAGLKRGRDDDPNSDGKRPKQG